MKEQVKSLLAHTLQKPRYVRHCSQTVYEALLACLRLFDATSEEVWKTRARDLLDVLLSIQRPDGGFDIGYDFFFGRLHKTGESTSPELVGLIAVCEYGRRFGVEEIREPALRASNWIGRFARKQPDSAWAIPYAPYSTDEIMIYNGTSFAAGALGAYLGVVDPDSDLRRVYEGMVRYLDGVMRRDEALPGRYWMYADQERDDLPPERACRIDYYHQMQQVEVHALAEQRTSAPGQLEMIRDAADHVVGLQALHAVIPYTQNDSDFGGLIHTWGLSSVVPGLLEASVLLPDRQADYQAVARKVLDWLLEHAWTGERFVAVLTRTGEPVLEEYMVRSDGWVLNAMSAACVHLGPGPWQDVVDPCFEKMTSVGFSGPENHASTRVKRVTTKVIDVLVKLVADRKKRPGSEPMSE